MTATGHGTTQKFLKMPKTVIAKYVLYSTFTIPDDVSEYEIHWDNLTYTDAEGNDVELEPTTDCKDDHEVYHRPADTWIEDEIGEQEPPIGFYTQCEGKTEDDDDESDIIEVAYKAGEERFYRDAQDAADEAADKDKEKEEEISSHPTLTFNPYLDIFVDGDVHGMTLKVAIEKLIFCDDVLIYKDKEPAFIKRWGPNYEREEANLYELLNRDSIPDPPASYVAWFKRQLQKKSTAE